jgi:hypothetical protein
MDSSSSDTSDDSSKFQRYKRVILVGIGCFYTSYIEEDQLTGK